MKTEGYKVKSYSQPVKRYCQTLSLRDNPELIEAYRKAHSKEESWPGNSGNGNIHIGV